jgi:hypothetical protein
LRVFLRVWFVAVVISVSLVPSSLTAILQRVSE